MKTNKFKLAGNLAGLIMILIIPFLLNYTNLRAQENSQDNIDDEADLFNANIDYKSMFGDLSSDGEWIQMNKEDLINNSNESDGNSGGISDAKSSGKFGFVWVWRPNIYYWGWSPYSNGRWEYTDDGWCWVSDYDWGWACYHYGRWVFDDFYGWIWIPGSYWAPAWVDWCYNDYYVGWYPRGLRYWNYDYYGYHHRRHYERWIFVHRTDFHDKEINKTVIVKKEKIKEIINSSTNIAGVRNDGSKFITVGPKVKDIETTGNIKINQKKIDFTNIKSKTRVDESSIRIYKPTDKDLGINGTKKNKDDIKQSTVGGITPNQTGTVVNQNSTVGKVSTENNTTQNNENKKSVKTKNDKTQTPNETSPNINNKGTKTKNNNGNNETSPSIKSDPNTKNPNDINNNTEKTKSKKANNNNNNGSTNINNGKTVTNPPANKSNDTYSRKDKNKGSNNNGTVKSNNNSGNTRQPSGNVKQGNNSTPSHNSGNSGNHNSNSGTKSSNSGNHNSNSGNNNSGSKTKSNR
jgi:hypothetical protein